MAARAEQLLFGITLILAPLLLTISTFFWQNGQIGIVGGIVQVYSFMLWIPAMLGLLSLLRADMPRFAVWGTLLVAVVCVAGANFGTEGIYLAGIEKMLADLSTSVADLPTTVHAAIAPAGELVLNLPGLLFPLSLILIGYFLWRKSAVSPILAILLCLGAASFPASRIPRIEMLAHVADLLLLIGAGSIGLSILTRRAGQTAPSATLTANPGAGD